MRFTHHNGVERIAIAGLLVLGLGGTAPPSFAKDNSKTTNSAFQVVRTSQTAGIPQDTMELSTKRSAVKISIQHVRGIGAATIKRLTAEWPKSMQLVFRGFKALEGLTIKQGDVNETLHVTSQNISQHHGVVIRRSSNTIQVILSGKMLNARDNQLQLSWVDYYR